MKISGRVETQVRSKTTQKFRVGHSFEAKLKFLHAIVWGFQSQRRVQAGGGWVIPLLNPGVFRVAENIVWSNLKHH